MTLKQQATSKISQLHANKAKGLGPFLFNARMKADLSQKDVADHLGYNTAQVVSDWERGLRSPPAIMLKKLVKLYRVPMQDFFDVLLEERTTLLEKKLRKSLGMK